MGRLGHVFVLLFLSAGCGGLDQLDEDRLRGLIRLAKGMVYDELKNAGNTEEEIDTVMDTVVDELQTGGGETMEGCRELGRKTMLVYLDQETYLPSAASDNIACTVPLGGKVECRGADRMCVCRTDASLISERDDIYVSACNEAGGVSETFNFASTDLTDYETSSEGGNVLTFSIDEGDLGIRTPGRVFRINISDSDGNRPTTAEVEASLHVLDSSGYKVNKALATWKTGAAANIYDVDVGGGEPAEFDVFLMRGTFGVAKLGGYVDDVPVNAVSLGAGRYPDSIDIIAQNNDSNSKMFIVFSGVAKATLEAANYMVSYLITDAFGDVLVRGNEDMSVVGLEMLHPSHGDTYVSELGSACESGGRVLLIIGDNTSRIYLPSCRVVQ